MLSLFIKYACICFCSFYSYCKIIRIQAPQIQFYIFSICSSCIIAYITSTFYDQTIFFRIAILLICSYIFLLTYNSIKKTIILKTLCISYGLSFIFYTLASILISIPYILLYKVNTAVPYSQTAIPLGLTQILLTFGVLHSKRFSNGIRNFSRHSTQIILTISLLSILYVTFATFHSNHTTLTSRSVILIISIILSFFFLCYWRYRITQTYREKLRIANEKSLEDELHNQRERIADLEADNARLSQIVHKDNKIILAMLTAVTEHLENTISFTPEELAIQGKELSTQLQDMAKDRQGILSTQIRKTNILPKSGLHTVDGMLSFMETRAKEAGITYKLQIEENIKEIASNAIPEADLLHLLGDLIDNAIIATKHANDKRKLLIHLGRLQNHFLLEISDSGIPFSLDTYQSFGNEPHTTHRNDGGSGIGLMDIWKLKKKYKVSLHIYEYEEDDAIYTKKLTFIFDYKNHFLLQTPRYKEALYTLTRGDLHIFPTKTE